MSIAINSNEKTILWSFLKLKLYKLEKQEKLSQKFLNLVWLQLFKLKYITKNYRSRNILYQNDIY